MISVRRHVKSNKLIVGETLEKLSAAIKTLMPAILKKMGTDILLVSRSNTKKLNIKINKINKNWLLKVC
ncbi:hypothetical protein PCE01_00010 [Pediococcus cellicola]|nr:hypothetical protein PCE01_00010 [Pediococcus cellicola]